MIVFRCSRCSKVSISTEGHRCLHCGNEETRVSSIPENQTEARSTSTNDNDVFMHMQNKSAGTDFSVLSQASEKCNTAKLHESDGKDKDTKALNANRSHISSSQGEPVRPIVQNSILKEILISPGPTACSNTFRGADDGRYCPSTKSGASVPTKKLQHISEKSSRHKSKNNLKEKKTFKHNKNTKSIQNENTIRKLNLGRSHSSSPEKSILDSFTKDGISVNQLQDNQGNTDSDKLSGERSNPTINNDFQDDLKNTNAFPQNSAWSPQEVSRKGCNKNDLSEKLPIKSIKSPILKKVFLCNKCGKKFTDESKLKVHFLNHFKEKFFKCDRCDKEYFSEAHLKRHYKSHMDKGPFKCDLCELVFIRNCHLSRHRKKHILEPAADASTAQQKVDQSSQQREQETSDDDDPQKHFQTSAEEKIFLCTKCGVKFIRESDFNAHSLRHSVQKPFKCNICDKEFSYELYLNRHYRVHSLERPFTCKICGFSSTQGSNLNKHLKIHA